MDIKIKKTKKNVKERNDNDEAIIKLNVRDIRINRYDT